MRLRAPLLAIPLLLAACTTTQYRRAPVSLGEAVPPSQARCRVGAARSNPIVTEWPASEKANLEALLREGGVAVEYTGCAMRVLTQCRLPGRYAWQRTSLSTDAIEIAGKDELWAKLPLGAASLDGELSRSGKLKVKTRVIGQLRLEGASADTIPRDDACARATHVVGALSVGTFSLEADGTAKGEASLDVKAVSAGGSRERSAGVIRSAGDPEACAASTDDAPHRDCRSPIQVFLWPIVGRAAEEGPAGTVKVDLVSGNASQRWDVYYDDQVICTTPCSRWLDPARPILLRTREGNLRLRVRDLGPAADGGSAQVVANGISTPKLAVGASFGGTGLLAMMMGGAIALANCGDPATDPFADRGACSAAKTTALVGVAVTAVGAWFVVDSLPRAEVVPGGPAPRGGGFFSVTIGPGFVAGRF